jgi:hypothetical protein
MITDAEIDRLVAEKVMEWDVNFMSERPPFQESRVHWRDHENNTIYLPEQWCPSGSEEASMRVVDKVVGKWGTTVKIEGCAHAPDDGVIWTVEFSNMEGLDVSADSYSRNHAICAAALATVGVMIKV